MSDVKTVVADIEQAFDSSRYPAEFLEKYDQLECLAAGHGTETFLVKSKRREQLYVAKCYDKNLYDVVHENHILKSLSHSGLPVFADEFESDGLICIVREYIDGQPLHRYIAEHCPDSKEIIDICTQLCDILIYLHGQPAPVIHRDIKPQNVIVQSNGQVVLIDFDIARIYNREAETDTRFLGTRAYAPPEQYGFSQTDSRADIYAFGILLRYILTGSERENPNIRVYKPLERVIKKCTAFSPKERFPNAAAVKKALVKATPAAQRRKHILYVACGLAIAALCIFGGLKWWQYDHREIFTDDHTPAFVLVPSQMEDAVKYLNDEHHTDYFKIDGIANMGYMRQMLVDVYGYSQEYAFAMPPEEQKWPEENENNFYPWGLPDTEYVPRDIVVYTIVKVLWPDVVTDYSGLKDDNGEYPGVRVALAFAEKHGILKGANRPDDLTYGDIAYIIANAEKYYDRSK